jgi:hypothetical protein
VRQCRPLVAASGIPAARQTVFLKRAHSVLVAGKHRSNRDFPQSGKNLQAIS